MKDEITYTTAGGGTVTWKNGHGWDCTGCGDHGEGRWGSSAWANGHARTCHARG